MEKNKETEKELTLEDLDIRVSELRDFEMDDRPKNHVGH